MPSTVRVLATALAAGIAAAAAPLPADAAPSRADARATQSPLKTVLARQMRSAGRASGAYVFNASTGRAVFRWKHGTARILASNTKLFTTAAALARYGSEGTLGTEVLGQGRLNEDGVWRGDLILRGGGDPTFGSNRFTRRSYGVGATVETLARALTASGIERITGRVIGDESHFDSLRGGPDSSYRTSIWVGPLSALAYNRGLASEGGYGFQLNPPAFAAARLDDALEARDVVIRRRPRSGRAGAGLHVLASVDSPPMRRLAALTNKSSDNFFAEMLLKDLSFQASGRGSTRGGARLAAAHARRLGSRARLVDGSGLSRGNVASPAEVGDLLLAILHEDYSDAFLRSLAVAGADGTLATRMRSGPARGRCHGKTGTLSNVSALSGYCEARSGDTYAFSILMNGVYTAPARVVQDRMLQAIAAVRR